MVLANSINISRTLLAGLLEVVDTLPWVPVARGRVHSFVIHSHAAFASADDEEVLGWPLGPRLLPESLVFLLDLFILGGREAIAVLLSHHSYGPITLVEAIDRGSLAVAQQPVQLGLHRARELLNAGIKVGLVGLGPTTEKTRRERTLVGRLITV